MIQYPDHRAGQTRVGTQTCAGTQTPPGLRTPDDLGASMTSGRP